MFALTSHAKNAETRSMWRCKNYLYTKLSYKKPTKKKGGGRRYRHRNGVQRDDLCMHLNKPFHSTTQHNTQQHTTAGAKSMNSAGIHKEEKGKFKPLSATLPPPLPSPRPDTCHGCRNVGHINLFNLCR